MATKRFVILSMAAAVLLEIHLAARGWPPLTWVCATSFVAALAAGAAGFRVASWLVLASAYAVPAMFQIAVGHFDVGFESAWLCGLAGMMLPALWRTGWEAPARWRLPIAAWALVVAGVWPIVVLREIDGIPALLLDRTLVTATLAGQVPVAVVWILSVATSVGGMLLAFDWLLGRYRRGSRQRFEREIVWPLAASWIVSALASIYQSFYTIGFADPTVFAVRGRAAGLFLDANAYGIVAALWGPAWVVLSRSISWTRLRVFAGLAGMALSWLGVWASGSKSAFVAAVVCMFFVVFHDVRRHEPGPVPGFWPGKGILGAAAVAVIMAVPIALMPRTIIVGPVARIRNEIAGKSPTAVAEHLWSRDGYALVANRMIEEHPFVGVGLGSFPLLLADYSDLLRFPTRLKFDNAQNWFRQQLAELGLAGSLPAIVLVCRLFMFLARTHGSGIDGPPAGMIKGALVALGLVSLVGLPTQVPAVALTFFVLICWYLMFVEPGAVDELNGEAVRSGAVARGLALALVVWSIGGTAVVATTVLRLPQRSLRADRSYMHGMNDLEHGGNEPAFRWTGQRAVAVFRVEASYLKLRFRVSHPDVVAHPVDVKIWRTDASGPRLIVATTLIDGAPVTMYVRAPADHATMMLETWVSRTWTPRDHGQQDTRALGLAVDDWTFVQTPPPGATVVPVDRH